MNWIRLKIYLLILTTRLVIITCKTCSTGWFGPKCQYQCHCQEMKCGETGECDQGAKCENGWFEYLCQYQDLMDHAYMSVTTNPKQNETTWLTDYSESTCNTDPSLMSVTVMFKDPQIFTWLQVSVKNQISVNELKLLLHENESTPRILCNESTPFKVLHLRFEIRCKVNVAITKLNVFGLATKSLCRLYINGGRNVALKQPTYQSDNVQAGVLTSSDLAVDGSSSQRPEDNSCAQSTEQLTQAPTWTLTYEKEFNIFRFIVHNIMDVGHRLQGYTLECYDAHHERVFTYLDTNEDQREIYFFLNDHWKQPIKSIYITASNLSSEGFLALCEVETYGDCIAGTTKLDCEICPPKCFNSSCFRNGSCLEGCSGFSDPPFCTQACKVDVWGLNCLQSCNKCVGGVCNSTTGYCPGACNGFRNLPECTEECSPGTWGENCFMICPNCTDVKCHPQEGLCAEVCSGFSDPPECSIACTQGRWGPYCASNCSHCENEICESTTSGNCKGLCVGYTNPPLCNEECRNDTYGVQCKETCSSHCVQGFCHTQTGNCTLGCEEGYTPPDCKVAVAVNVKEEESSSYIIPIIIAILLIALIAALFIFCRPKKKKVDDNNYDAAASAADDDNVDTDDEIEPRMAVGVINSFMLNHDFSYFQRIFQSVPEAETDPESAGLDPDNVEKNVDPLIYAYDHNRVVLLPPEDDDESDDYINASFIKGYAKEKQFIACQGPTEATINDFVRMLWEQEADVIVVLANRVENNVVTSEDYWSKDQMFDDIQVNLMYEDEYAEFSIRQLELSKDDDEPKPVTQYQYTSWPQTGVPALPWSFVDFERTVASHATTRPIIVHCRTGADRTGVFIALHNVLEDAEATGEVDFFQTLVTLRTERLSMIGTTEQYWFLHRAVQVGVMCLGNTLTATNIGERIKSLDDKRLQEEYKAVCILADIFRTKQVTGTQVKLEHNIDAVLLQGFAKGNKVILTPLPEPDDVFAFWSMVDKYKVVAIVCLDLSDTEEDELEFNYLPPNENEHLLCESFTIATNEFSQTKRWKEHKLVAHLKDNEYHKLTSLVANFEDFDDSIDCLAFMQRASEIKVSSGEAIIFTCRDGAVRSGMACVLSNLIEKLENCVCLTVPLVVCSVKSARPGAFPTVEQYKDVYQMLETALLYLHNVE